MYHFPKSEQVDLDSPAKTFFKEDKNNSNWAVRSKQQVDFYWQFLQADQAITVEKQEQ